MYWLINIALTIGFLVLAGGVGNPFAGFLGYLRAAIVANRVEFFRVMAVVTMTATWVGQLVSWIFDKWRWEVYGVLMFCGLIFALIILFRPAPGAAPVAPPPGMPAPLPVLQIFRGLGITIGAIVVLFVLGFAIHAVLHNCYI